MYQSDTALMRPIQYAEHYLVTSILNGSYPPGSVLPAERTLAGEIGVTRQTLREALQRLSRDRWVTISHGKPTRVNDLWREGGMGMLATMVRYPDYLHRAFIRDLLQARVVFMPECAVPAVSNHREVFRAYLAPGMTAAHDAQTVADYDWQLQSMMVHYSGNRVYPLMLNDFAPVFKVMGQQYFTLPRARSASAAYYQDLLEAISENGDIRAVVEQAMRESIDIWDRLKEKADD